jgi:hypothetical protein
MALIDDAMRKKRDCGGESAIRFFPHRRRVKLLLLLLAICAVLALLPLRRSLAAVQRRCAAIFCPLSVPDEVSELATQPQLSPYECVQRLSVRSVQVGPYETKALIDGRLMRQGEKISCGAVRLTFLGVQGKELIFVDEAGESLSRPFRLSGNE